MKPQKIILELDPAAPKHAAFMNTATLSHETKTPAAFPEFDYGRYIVTDLKRKGDVCIVKLSLQK